MATINAINSNIPIEISKGGTNATSMGTTNGVNYYDGTSLVTTAAGTSAQVLTSNGTGSAPTYQNTGTDSLVLISSQTASASASISFTGLTTYSNYLLILSDIQPLLDQVDLRMTVSQDNGATYLNSGYTSQLLKHDYNSATLVSKNSTTYFYVATDFSGTKITSGTYYLFNVNIASAFEWAGISNFDDNSVSSITSSGVVGGQAGTSINAIKFEVYKTAGGLIGVINQGRFTLFGIKNS